MKFAHLGDCHLGGWRQPELRTLNFQSFQEAVARCIKKKVEFALIAGDLFDSPYPPIETLKNTFAEFRKLKDAKIPVFIIAGSHDYSVSGKTFLDVLEKAGFCKNVSKFAEKNSKIFLEPTLYKNIAIYGFSGKKSGMEVEEIERIKIQDSPGLFKILILHTQAQPFPTIYQGWKNCSAVHSVFLTTAELKESRLKLKKSFPFIWKLIIPLQQQKKYLISLKTKRSKIKSLSLEYQEYLKKAK